MNSSGSGRAQGPQDYLVLLSPGPASMGSLMNEAGFSPMANLVPLRRYRKGSEWILTLFLNAALKHSLLELDYHGICGILFLLLHQAFPSASWCQYNVSRTQKTIPVMKELTRMGSSTWPPDQASLRKDLLVCHRVCTASQWALPNTVLILDDSCCSTKETKGCSCGADAQPPCCTSCGV